MTTRPTESELEGAWILRFLMPKLTDENSWPLKIFHVTPEGDETEIGSATIGLKEDDLIDFVKDEVEKWHYRLVLDLEAVEDIDAIGVVEIIAASSVAGYSGGELVIANLTSLTPSVEKILRTNESGPWAFDSISEAVQYFRRSAEDCS